MILVIMTILLHCSMQKFVHYQSNSEGMNFILLLSFKIATGIVKCK